MKSFVKGESKTKKTSSGFARHLEFKKGFLKNPFFYFGFFSLFLFGLLFFSSDGLVGISHSKNNAAGFYKNIDNSENNDLFFNQNKLLAVETPDLKIIQDNFVYGISTPHIVTTQVLGSMFGESSLVDRKEIIEYSVESGDTIKGVAGKFGVSEDTIAWANNISKNSALKVGQTLVILPVSGVLHIVKAGDTIGAISKTYKAKMEDIISTNSLSGELDIFIGDILIIKGGSMPPKPISSIVSAPLNESLFIYPAEGQITQGLHFYNAVDLANKCGAPVYAAASGVVQRVRYGWNFGGGNQVTILHAGGIVTYYGLLMTIFVKPGDSIDVGQRLGLMGSTGLSTGCHVHFGVTGAKNPLAKFFIGSVIKYK